ncbi:MAG TPA: acyltransferase family protein, partial [Mycobacteriales bacterium]|nr:acyltransferase family protein [Mycobacteriales bacterium]
ALFLLLVGVSAGAAVWASPAQRAALRGDALATLGYVANWRFVLADRSYFAQYDEPSPLRHMWSLGIEEQFYLLYPLLLIGLLTLGLRRRGLAVVLGLGALASAALAAALYTPGADPSRVYYGTDTRLQALLVGAVAAVLAREATRRPGRYVELAGREVPLPGRGSIGLFALAGLAIVLVAGRDTAGWLYRGGFLLVAVLAVVVVTAAADDRSSTARLLSWEPLRRTGLVSYGLYLWHWPVYVVLTPDRVGATGPALLVLRLAVTGLLAAGSYVLVEQPVRTGRAIRGWSPRRLAPLVAATVVAVVAVVFGGTAGAGPSAGAPVAAAVEQQRRPDDVAVYLLGDSVPYSLRVGFRPETVPGLFVAGSTQLGCGLIPVPLAIDGQPKTLDERCQPWDAAWPADVAAVRPDVAVLFAGIGEQFDQVVDGTVVRFGTPAYEQHLVTVLDSDTRRLGIGQRPVALVTVGCHRVPDSGVSPDPAIINDESRVRWLNGVLSRYAARHKITLLDLHGFLCADGYRATKDGVTLRSDGLHFSEAGAAVVWRWLGPRLRKLADR